MCSFINCWNCFTTNIFSRRPTFDLKIALTLIGMCDTKFQSLMEFTTQHYHRWFGFRAEPARMAWESESAIYLDCRKNMWTLLHCLSVSAWLFICLSVCSFIHFWNCFKNSYYIKISISGTSAKIWRTRTANQPLSFIKKTCSIFHKWHQSFS